MSIRKRYLGAALATLAFCAVNGVSAVDAAVPTTLTQQGRLLSAAGAPVDADLSFVFSIYSAPTGGTALWTETQTVSVEAGYFSARLGGTTAFPGTLFDGTATLFLGIKIGSDAEMTPRQQVTSVPFARHAAEADHAATATLATNATNAVTATNANSATTATTATNVTGAITPSAITVNGKAIVDSTGTLKLGAQFTRPAAVTGTGTATATCASGTSAISGGCDSVSGGSLIDATYLLAKGSGDVPTGFTCAVASGSVTARAICGPN